MMRRRPNMPEDRICAHLVLGASVPFCLYTAPMAQVTLDLPDVLSTFLAASGHNLEHAALQAIALEAYREGKLSTAQLRRVLGYHTRTQVHAFLKEHGVYLRYGLADLE